MTRATLATLPFGIAVLFSPQRTHVEEPGTLVQVTDFPTPAATEPGVTVADEKSVVG
jgi:hypothetical protein